MEATRQGREAKKTIGFMKYEGVSNKRLLVKEVTAGESKKLKGAKKIVTRVRLDKNYCLERALYLVRRPHCQRLRSRRLRSRTSANLLPRGGTRDNRKVPKNWHEGVQGCEKKLKPNFSMDRKELKKTSKRNRVYNSKIRKHGGVEKKKIWGQKAV